MEAHSSNTLSLPCTDLEMKAVLNTGFVLRVPLDFGISELTQEIRVSTQRGSGWLQTERLPCRVQTTHSTYAHLVSRLSSNGYDGPVIIDEPTVEVG